MAVITANVGSFVASSPSAWVGGVVPTSTDTVDVPVGSTITIDAPISFGATTVEGTLINSSVLTMAGNLTIGSASVGEYVFGAGSELALGTNSLLLNCAKLRSIATNLSWAKITGTGTIGNGVAGTFPAYNKQNIEIPYVSIQTTGSVVLNVGTTLGSQIARIVLDNVVFVGAASVTLGNIYVTKATEFRIRNCSFVDCNTVDFKRVTGAGDCTNTEISGNLIKSSVPNKTFAIWGFQGVPVTGNVLIGYMFMNNYTPSSSLEDNVHIIPTASASGTDGFVGGAVCTPSVKNSLFWAGSSNAHFLNLGSATGSIEVTGNIFDAVDSSTDNVITAKRGVNMHHNIALGNAKGISVASTGAYDDLYVENNTLVGPTEGVTCLLFAHGQATGNFYVRSNLYKGVQAYTILVSEAYSHVVNFSGYNNMYGVTTPYQLTNLTVTAGTETDISPAKDPLYVDPTRSFKTYYSYKTGEGWNEVNAIAKWAAFKGYNPTTKCNDAIASGLTVSDALSWIKAGFVPTEQTLKGAGYLGVDIGALPVIPSGGGSSNNTASSNGFLLGIRYALISPMIQPYMSPIQTVLS